MVQENFIEAVMPYLVLIVSVLVAQRLAIGKLPPLLLADLLYANLVRPDAAVAAAQDESAPISKKKAKKLQQQQSSQSGNAQLTWSYISAKLLDHLEFVEELDYLLLCAAVLVVNAMTSVIMKWFVTPAFPQLLFNLVVTSAGFVLVFMIKVEWSHGVIARQEKLYMVLSGIMAFIFSFSLLMYAPSHLLDFHPAEATRELTERLARLVQSRIKKLPAGELVPVDNPVYLSASLSLMAAVISALLMAPGLRYGRILQQWLTPPMWAKRFAAGNPLMQLGGQAGFVLQVLMIPLWVPLMTEALQIPRETLSHLRGSALLLAAVLQGAVVPQLVQTFLYVAAYNGTVIAQAPSFDQELKGQLLKRQVQVTLAQACKVALQLLFVPMLLLLCALLHILIALPSPLAAASNAAHGWHAQPSVLFQSVAGFLGWWISLSYVFWASINIFLIRLSTTNNV